LTALRDLQYLGYLVVTGVGGSLLSVGSAAGVAVMGVSKDYSFTAHLKYIPTIALGYAASIYTWSPVIQYFNIWLN
jgi:Na+/H+ antiporter NhaD/arsenite permease-like protein